MPSSDGPVHDKFKVTRTDGRSAPGKKHDDCQYFVLDVTHDPYAGPALEAYAEWCRDDYPELSQSIWDTYLDCEDARRNTLLDRALGVE